MKNLSDILAQEQSMRTLVGLTNVFEGIASLRISQVKDQVLQSKEFFSELWNIYTDLREGNEFHFGRQDLDQKIIDKELLIIITAEGGFSGDIDEKLISLMLNTYEQSKQDIIVIGHHGAVRLAQRGIYFKRYYKLPSRDSDINVSPIVAEVQKYQSTSVYYQTYVSLMVQDVKKISLSTAVTQQGKTIKKTKKEKVTTNKKEINERTYIFEPSTYAVVDHIERSMMHIALSQVILESKLAQYASRFRAMSGAHDKAKSSLVEVRAQGSRAKRSLKDERLKEVVSSLKKVRMQK